MSYISTEQNAAVRTKLGAPQRQPIGSSHDAPTLDRSLKERSPRPTNPPNTPDAITAGGPQPGPSRLRRIWDQIRNHGGYRGTLSQQSLEKIGHAAGDVRR